VTQRDRPWLIRTYSGHSSARASNELYRNNLAKGQTGLSVAFDLPTQIGHDADAPMARGEVGKVGVSISSLKDMETLLDGILGRGKNVVKDGAPVEGQRVAVLYRRACEHLALARARSYPAYLLDQLERLTSDAHQVIYQRREFGLLKVKRFLTEEFPRSVRAHSTYVWIAAALLYIPTFVIGWLVYRRPEFVGSAFAPCELLSGGAAHQKNGDHCQHDDERESDKIDQEKPNVGRRRTGF